MATVENQYFILEGAETTTQDTFTVVATGSTGTPGALRTITNPSTESPTVTYYRNPDRTINFISDPLAAPIGKVRRTLGTTLPFVDASSMSDVLVTEVWEGSARRAAMTTSFFKLLWEVWINLPDVGEFVIWDPLDLVDDGTQYNVVVVDIRVGGSSGKLDAKDFGAAQLEGIDAVTTGVLNRTVEMDLLIRSVVA